MNDNYPLSQPLYGASFPQTITRFFKKYAVFSGRASRSEFWYTYLFLVLVSLALNLLDRSQEITFFTYISIIWSLAMVIPMLALMSRRLHDANFSAWFLLFYLLPIVGPIVLLILCALPSKPMGVRFDPNSTQINVETPYMDERLVMDPGGVTDDPSNPYADYPQQASHQNPPNYQNPSNQNELR